MTNYISFFIDIGKLKSTRKKKWFAYEIKDSESTASHSFRLAILSWILAKKERLDMKKVLKMALIHDFCEIFAQNETSFEFLLPQKKKISKISLKKKKQNADEKFKREYQSFSKVILKLPPELKKELRTLWLDFERGLSKEGKLVKQADKAESLLQAFEYWKEQGKIQKASWIRWARENFDIPIILEFIKAIEKRFFEKNIFEKILKRNEMDNIVEFLIEVGKLKKLKRRGWVLRRVKEPEVVASHSYRLALVAWILGRQKELNIEKILKMALTHDLCEVYAGDETPYDEILPKGEKELSDLMKTWPRFPVATKRKKESRKLKREQDSLFKLIKRMPQSIKKEITNLWFDFREGVNHEGRFLRQLDKLENLLQAFEYRREDKNFPMGSWWMEAKERTDDSLLVKFIDDLAKEFSEVSKYE